MKDSAKAKGLTEIKTIGARSSLAKDMPHKLHMRLCTLEMERYRRDQERRVALERAAKCQSRCEQIEQEVRQLMEQINRNAAVAPVAANRAVRAIGQTLAGKSAGAAPVPMKHRY